MRLIDAEALDDTFVRLNADNWQLTRGDYKRMDSVLFEMPTIDAVPVVRCRECELWNDWDHSGRNELGNFVCSCAHWSNEDGYVVYTKPDDFCSYGERKDG